MVYAIRLIDAGLLEKAYRYLVAIGHLLLLLLDDAGANEEVDASNEVDPFCFSLVSNCLRLVEPLENHWEVKYLENSLFDDPLTMFDEPRRHPIKRLNRQVHTSTQIDWLEQLRQHYDKMNKQVITLKYTNLLMF